MTGIRLVIKDRVFITGTILVINKESSKTGTSQQEQDSQPVLQEIALIISHGWRLQLHNPTAQTRFTGRTCHSFDFNRR